MAGGVVFTPGIVAGSVGIASGGMRSSGWQEKRSLAIFGAAPEAPGGNTEREANNSQVEGSGTATTVIVPVVDRAEVSHLFSIALRGGGASTHV